MAKEYIEREAFIEILKKTKKDCEHYADKVCCDFAIRMVNLMPPADVKEVVRCKDCKWLNKTKMICTCPNNRVFNTGKTVYSNNFCSYGAKMDKE